MTSKVIEEWSDLHEKHLHNINLEVDKLVCLKQADLLYSLAMQEETDPYRKFLLTGASNLMYMLATDYYSVVSKGNYANTGRY